MFSWAGRILHGLWNLAGEGQRPRECVLLGLCLLPGGLVEAGRKQQPRILLTINVRESRLSMWTSTKSFVLFPSFDVSEDTIKGKYLFKMGDRL